MFSFRSGEKSQFFFFFFGSQADNESGAYQTENFSHTKCRGPFSHIYFFLSLVSPNLVKSSVRSALLTIH